MDEQDWSSGHTRRLAQHEHSSDTDNDMSQHGRRLRSYSDEISSYAGNNKQDYQIQHRNAQELHHRHIHATAGRELQDSDNVRANVVTPNNGHVGATTKPYSLQPKRARTRKRWTSTTAAKCGVAVLVIGYVLLVIRGSLLLNREYELESIGGSGGNGFWSRTAIGPATRPTAGMFATRERMERQRIQQHLKVDKQRLESNQQRANRNRPAPLDEEEEPPLVYSFARMDDEPRTTSHHALLAAEQQSPAALPVASLDQLCGTHARNASLAHPNSFLARDALNSKSRVYITGILSPIGLNLALALHQQCGVEVIGGADAMFPNTVLNRLDMLRRIELLTTYIPKMVHPVQLPLVGLDPRFNKPQSESQKIPDMLDVTSEQSILNMNPTHIIHLASYAPEQYSTDDEQLLNKQSPYASPGRNPDMYRVRSNVVAMEHILSSIVSAANDDQRPHLAYASSVPLRQAHDDSVHFHFKLADEILADTYHAKNGVFSTGIRLPNAVYGPWGMPGSATHRLAKEAIEFWGHSAPPSLLLESAGLANQTSIVQSLVHVNDIVDGIIAAMQYREADSKSAVFDFSPDATTTLSSIAKVVVQQMPQQQDGGSETALALTPTTSPLVLKTRELLHWSPSTSFQEGLTKTIAWHLDQAFPFGEHKKAEKGENEANALEFETGDAFRKRAGMETCEANDLVCHAGSKYLPCVSECSTKDKCIPSIFDDVLALVHDISKDCDIVLYTQNFGPNIHDLELSAKYKDEGKTIVCNFAFVPRTSHLVHAAIEKVPPNQLDIFGIALNEEELEDPAVTRERKLDGLNGRLLYKGWILVWMDGAHEQLATHDKFMVKQSPKKFFSSDVDHAVYVDQDFPVSPNIDDVLFLVSQLHRPKIKERRVYRKDEHGKKHKYKLAAEPERKAAILAAPLKQHNHKEAKRNTAVEKHKLSVHDAVKFMMVEIGEDYHAKEKPEVRRQREFCERIATFTNRVDLRSTDAPWYRFDMRHWIRSRWIVHDLKLEESRQLRCEWYQEQVQWGNDLDQLSFAYVMAVRELKRRIAHAEPDDHIKPVYVQHPELLSLTDAHEWFALESEENRLALIHPSDVIAAIPQHMVEEDEHGHHDTKEEDAAEEQMRLHHSEAKHKRKPVPLFVRIMSERIMMLARRAWAEKHYSAKALKKLVKPKKKKK